MNNDEIDRWDNIKPLVAGTDARDKIARRVATKAGAAPALPLPFGHQHVFEIEFAAAGRGAIVPPSKRERAIRPRSAPAIRERIGFEDGRTAREHDLPQLRPLSRAQLPARGQERIARAIREIALRSESEPPQTRGQFVAQENMLVVPAEFSPLR